MGTIIAAAISGAVTLIVCVINSSMQSKKILSEIQNHNSIQSYQIQELTKQVEKHNRVIERVYNLEKEDVAEKEQLKSLNHRVKDLEQFHK